jgi:hypothetical protein
MRALWPRARPAAHWPEGPVCGTCYARALEAKGCCPECGETRRLMRYPGYEEPAVVSAPARPLTISAGGAAPRRHPTPAVCADAASFTTGSPNFSGTDLSALPSGSTSCLTSSAPLAPRRTRSSGWAAAPRSRCSLRSPAASCRAPMRRSIVTPPTRQSGDSSISSSRPGRCRHAIPRSLGSSGGQNSSWRRTTRNRRCARLLTGSCCAGTGERASGRCSTTVF